MVPEMITGTDYRLTRISAKSSNYQRYIVLEVIYRRKIERGATPDLMTGRGD